MRSLIVELKDSVAESPEEISLLFTSFSWSSDSPVEDFSAVISFIDTDSLNALMFGLSAAFSELLALVMRALNLVTLSAFGSAWERSMEAFLPLIFRRLTFCFDGFSSDFCGIAVSFRGFSPGFNGFSAGTDGEFVDKPTFEAGDSSFGCSGET